MPTPNSDTFADKVFPNWRREHLPPVVEQVRQMETQRQRAIELLGEVLATLLLEGNQYLFKHAPEDWHALVKSWRVRYNCLKTKGEEEITEQ